MILPIKWTRFTKDQLQMLKRHWRIPDVIVTTHCHQFTSDEVLIMCLAWIASGDPWINFVPSNFGGDCWRCSYMYRRFTNHLFEMFYHKISGRSIELWIDNLDHYKEIILNALHNPLIPSKGNILMQLGTPKEPKTLFSVHPNIGAFLVSFMKLLLEHLDLFQALLVQQLVVVIIEDKMQIRSNAFFIG